MRKTIATLGLATALSLTPVAATAADAHGPAAHRAVVAETPAPNQNNDNYHSSGNKGLWGLLGLVGLLGLIPRRRKPEQPTQRPPAMNTTTRSTSGSHDYQGEMSNNPRR